MTTHKTFSFDDHRRADGTIRLQDCYRALYSNHGSALHYLADLEKIEHIRDTGAAAVALNTAWAFYAMKVNAIY